MQEVHGIQTKQNIRNSSDSESKSESEGPTVPTMKKRKIDDEDVCTHTCNMIN